MQTHHPTPASKTNVNSNTKIDELNVRAEPLKMTNANRSMDPPPLANAR